MFTNRSGFSREIAQYRTLIENLPGRAKIAAESGQTRRLNSRAVYRDSLIES